MDRKSGILVRLNSALLLGLMVFSQASPCSAQADRQVIASYRRGDSQLTATQQPKQPIRVDQQIELASAQQAPAAQQPVPTDQHRLLAPRSKPGAANQASQSQRVANAPAFALPKIESFTTAGAGLAIVVGLFMVCMLLLRGSTPKASSPLPNDAVSVLGRVPLAARNFAHLLKVGHKLVLVAITPDGVSPITEITDPAEVQRMLGLCMQNDKHSTSAEFREVLNHLTKEPAKGFLGKEAAGTNATQTR